MNDVDKYLGAIVTDIDLSKPETIVKKPRRLKEELVVTEKSIRLQPILTLIRSDRERAAMDRKKKMDKNQERPSMKTLRYPIFMTPLHLHHLINDLVSLKQKVHNEPHYDHHIEFKFIHEGNLHVMTMTVEKSKDESDS